MTYKDTRIVCGASCVWWDSIDKVSKRMPIPTCPHCGGVLFEIPSIEDWWKMVDQYEAAGHPGYHAIVEWMRSKCFKSLTMATAAYEADKPADQLRNQS